MPTPLKLPFPPLLQIDQDEPLEPRDLTRHLGSRLDAGVSFCVRSAAGPERRGGYFFHVRRDSSGQCWLATFDGEEVVSLDELSSLAALINHVSGRKYSEQMWEIAQRINLRKDRSETPRDNE